MYIDIPTHGKLHKSSRTKAKESEFRNAEIELTALADKAGILDQINAACSWDVDVIDLEKLRQIYFGIPDLSLRQKFLAVKAKCISLKYDYNHFYLSDMMFQFAGAHRKADTAATYVSIGWSIVMVAIGSIFFDIAGAIAGGVIALLIGMHKAREARWIARETRRMLTGYISTQQNNLKIAGSEILLFTKSEVDNGYRVSHDVKSNSNV